MPWTVAGVSGVVSPPITPAQPLRTPRPRDTVSKSESYRRSTRPAEHARESDVNVRRWMRKALVLGLAMSALLPATPAGAHDMDHLVDEERELVLLPAQRRG